MVLVFCVIAVMAMLFVGTRTVNFNAQAEILSSTRGLQELDATWNHNVRGSRAGQSSLMK